MPASALQVIVCHLVLISILVQYSGPVCDSIRSDRSLTRANDAFPGAKPIPLLFQKH